MHGLPSQDVPCAILAGRSSKMNDRKIVIIGGQPYYESTGRNSNAKGTWLPFVMMVGTKVAKVNGNFVIPNELQHDYHLPNKPAELRYQIELLLNDARRSKTNTRVLIKAEYDILNPNFNESNQIRPVLINGRISTKKDLINSMRLGGGLWNDPESKSIALSFLNHEEQELASQPINIEVDAETLTTSDPDVINDWLLSNGAVTINKLFDLNEMPKPPSLQSQSTDTKLTKVKCMLQEYIELREDEQNSFFHSFYSSFGKHDFAAKMHAADSLKKWLNGGSVTITQSQLSVLNEGRLGKVFAEIKKTKYYTTHKDNLIVAIPTKNSNLKHMGRKY